MTEKANTLDFHPTPRQWDARMVLDLDQVQNPEDPPIELLYGGAKGGGKSFFGCFWVLEYCRWVIQHFDLKPSKNPPHVGFMGRKLSTDFTGTTLATWRDNIPDSCYEFKGTGDKEVKHIVIDGCVAVDYGGLDRQENINKFNSAEYGFVFIDQAEETTINDISVLKASRRMKINGEALPYRGLWTANPAPCWLKGDFIDNPKPNHVFIQALPGDNEYLPKSYINVLKASFGHRPELLQAYLYGSWDTFEGIGQVIRGIWINQAEQRSGSETIHKRYLVCDTATYGDDECVIMRMNNAEIEDQIILPYCDHTQISTRLGVESRQNGDIPVVIESIGADTGEAVAVNLGKIGVHVIRYTPQGKSGKPEKYYNIRAEAWSMAATILCNGIFDEIHNIPVKVKNLDEKTKAQLCTPTYIFRGTKLLIESKKDIKKRLGNSPDRGDTYVIALWAWHKVPIPVVIERSFTERNRCGSGSAMSV